MQENLDVLLSFVVIIIGLSVFLQILVEIFKNFFHLRWNVYENFLVGMYQQFFYISVPKGLNKGKSKNGYRERIGSVTRRFKDFQNSIHSLVEHIKDVKSLVLKAEQKLKFTKDVDEQQLREELLKLFDKIDPVVSRLMAIDFDDLFKIYNRISSCNADNSQSANLIRFQKEIEKIRDLIKNLRDTDRGLVTFRDNALMLLRDISVALEKVESFICRLHAKFSLRGESLLRDLEYTYKKHITIWALVLGIIMVVGLNADSVLIYQTLRNEPVIRSSVMKKVDLLARHVDFTARSEAINDVASAANRVKYFLEKEHKWNPELYNDFENRFLAVSKSIEADARAYGNFHDNMEEVPTAHLSLPYNLSNESSPTIVLLNKYRFSYKANESLSPEAISKIESALNSALFRLSRNFAALQVGVVEAQKNLLYSVDLPLGWNMKRIKATFAGPWEFVKKLLGLFMTLVLISFGAPFWNEVLESLLGLKSFLRKA